MADTTGERSIWGRLGPALETSGRAVAFGAVLAYMIGLFVVNGYLFRLGVSDFSLLRPRLVFTGVLVVGFLGVAAFWVRLVVSLMSGTRHFLLRAFLVLASVITPVAMLQFVLDAEDEAAEWRATLLLLGSGALLTLFVIGVFADSPLRSPKSTDASTAEGDAPRRGGGADARSWARRAAADPLLPFTLLFLVVVYLLVVAWIAYPAVPEQFGGGRPHRARLVLDAAARPGLEALGVPMASADASGCVELVFVTEDAYVLRLERRSVLEVPKAAVRGILIDPGSGDAGC